MDLPREKVVCVPCHLDSYHDDSSSLLIFIVDLSRGDAAVFRIGDGVFSADVSCVLKSTLYLFKGLEGGVTAATIDLSELLVENPPSPANKIIDLTRDHLSNTCVVVPAHRKRSPDATPTPGGKILLFSRSIDKLDKNHVVDFELYDPLTNEWTQLPPIESSKEFFSILRYAFLDESAWFIETDKAGMFDLDLRSPTKWQARGPLAGEGRLVSHFSSSFKLFKELGSIGFSDFAAFDVDESKHGRGLSVISYLDPNYSFPSSYRYADVSGAPFFDADDSELKFCQFQTALNAKTKYPLVTLDIICLDLAKYKEAKKNADRQYRKGLLRLKRKRTEDKRRLTMEGRLGKERRLTLRLKYSTLKQNLKDGLFVQLPARLDKSFDLPLGLHQKCTSFDPSGLFFLSS